jgi:hypothetical protein
MNEQARPPPGRVEPGGRHDPPGPMKRPGDSPREPSFHTSDVERWIDKWKHRLLGIVVDGMCANHDIRARMVMNTPGLLDSILRQMYADMTIAAREPPGNGTKPRPS